MIRIALALVLVSGLVGCAAPIDEIPQETSSTPPATGAKAEPPGNVSAAKLPARSFAIGGAVQGLKGKGLELQMNESKIAIDQDGRFSVPGTFRKGTHYEVFVAELPSSPWQDCTIANGEGVVGDEDVGTIAVACHTRKLTLKGVASGVLDAITIRNSNGDAVMLGGNGKFEFPTQLESGAAYSVTVSSTERQPCRVVNGSGDVAGQNVEVSVECTME
jgi:trimeric autotransporter adhesin